MDLEWLACLKEIQRNQTEEKTAMKEDENNRNHDADERQPLETSKPIEASADTSAAPTMTGGHAAKGQTQSRTVQEWLRQGVLLSTSRHDACAMSIKKHLQAYAVGDTVVICQSLETRLNKFSNRNKTGEPSFAYSLLLISGCTSCSQPHGPSERYH